MGGEGELLLGERFELRILGIDPGSNILGWALIETEPLTLLYHGFDAPKGDADIRIQWLYHVWGHRFHYDLPNIGVDCIAMEQAFTKRASAAWILGAVSWCIRVHAKASNILVVPAPRPHVQLVVGGKGGASKEEMAEAVWQLMPDAPRGDLKKQKGLQDVLDAIAAAITVGKDPNLIKGE